MESSIYGVLLAGGSGTRFWPLSTKDQPKQFLSLVEEETMIQTTDHRCKGLIKPENWVVVTNEAYSDKVAEQLPQLEKDQIIGEPGPSVKSAPARSSRRSCSSTIAPNTCVALPGPRALWRFGTIVRSSIMPPVITTPIVACFAALLSVGAAPTTPRKRRPPCRRCCRA